jgi:hypothetical protein
MKPGKIIVMRKSKNLFASATKIGLMLMLVISGISVKAADDATKKTSVLVTCPDFAYFGLDINYLRLLHDKEKFNVDWLDFRGNGGVLSPDRLKQYNVLVVIDPPAFHSGALKDQKTVDDFCDMLDNFMAEGGGVLLLYSPSVWDSKLCYAAYENTFVKRYGAGFLQQQLIVEDNPENRVENLGVNENCCNYFYTDNVMSHPVTAGSKGLWYPMSTQFTAKQDNTYRDNYTYALSLSPQWQTLISGSPTSHTRTGKYRYLELKLPVLQSVTEVTAPPLLAARDFKKGRMVFGMTDPKWHFGGATMLVNGGQFGFDEIWNGSDPCKLSNVMQGPLKGRESSLHQLIVNALDWLAEPSLASGTLGGYRQNMARIKNPDPGPTPLADWKNQKFDSEGENSKGMRSFRGLIGARTATSGGQGTVAEYRQAGLKAGLDYLVFLEDFAQLTPDKYKSFGEECKKNSDAQFTCIPGVAVDDNIGHSVFYYGFEYYWPSPKFIDPDGRRLNCRTKDKDDGNVSLPHQNELLHIFNRINWGYYNFSANPASAPMYDLRVYNSVGLSYYKNGREVEGLAQNFKGYLEINNQGCNIQPQSVDIVTDPAGIKTAVADGRMLTCVLARDREGIMPALRYEYLRPPTAYVSSGPVIREWSCLNRDYVTYADEWVTPNYRFRVKLDVESDAGLTEIRIWDGLKLWGVIRPNGAKRFTHVFELAHDRQKNLILEITDANGRKAISGEQFDRSHINMHYWCGDRNNGSLWHGPHYFVYNGDTDKEVGVALGTKFTDGGGASVSCGGGGSGTVKTSKGDFEPRRLVNRPLQEMISTDAGILSNSCIDTYPANAPVYNAYSTYGPLVPAELFHLFQTRIGFRNHYGRPTVGNPSLSGIPDPGDITMLLQENKYVFQTDLTVRQLPLFGMSYGTYGLLQNNQMMVMISRNPRSAPIVVRWPQDRALLEKEVSRADQPLVIEHGGFISVSATQSKSGALVNFNIGNEPWRVRPEGQFVQVYAELDGKEFKKDEAYTFRCLRIVGKVRDNNVGERHLGIQQYLFGEKRGYDVKLAKGKLLPVTDGTLDMEAQGGGADFSIPNPKVNLQLTLGCRVSGLNDHWSAYFYDKIGKRARPIGTWKNVAHVRLEPERAELTDVQVGHPVAADNNDVVILFSVLGDGKYPVRKDGMLCYDGTYSLQVNNPTDKDLTVTLKKNMDLPGFPFATKTVDIKAGQIIDVIKN